MARQPNGRPSIYHGADGLYHCWLPDGTGPSGKLVRKHIKRATSSEVAAAVDEYLARKKRGSGIAAKIETLDEWLDHWVHVILKTRVGYGKLKHGAWVDYEKVVRVHLKPRLGSWRITGTKRRLEPEHVEHAYAEILASGRAPSYVSKMHTILGQAIRTAYRHGRADRNVMELVEPPEFDAKRVDALTLKEARAVLSEALADPLAARWALGIIAGPRQGEVLGMRWTDIVLDPDEDGVPHIQPGKQLQRRSWQHGCDDPHACAVKHCRLKPCAPRFAHGCAEPAGCKKLARYCPKRKTGGQCPRHLAKVCPPPCTKTCIRHAKACPQKTGGGLVEEDLKSSASSGAIALGSALTDLLRKHREAQIRERADAGLEFDPAGYVFTAAAGRPIDPRADYGNWCALITRASVKHHRLHAARHTTGTFLRATGSDLKMIKDVLRHAHLSTSEIYIDVAMEAKRDAVDRVAAALMDGDLTVLLKVAGRVA